jgi:hypothetical protein
MFKLTELPKEEEEHTELTDVLVLIFHLNAMFKCGLLKSNQMLENKVKLNKLPRAKYQ